MKRNFLKVIPILLSVVFAVSVCGFASADVKADEDEVVGEEIIYDEPVEGQGSESETTDLSENKETTDESTDESTDGSTDEPTDEPTGEPTENQNEETTTTEPTPDPEKEQMVRDFVERLYDKCLSRSSDVDGIAFWTDSLCNGLDTGAHVAYLFVFSDEYVNSGASNKDYLTMLYYAFFDREPDEAGFDYWMFQLEHSGCSRKLIFENFVNSKEFYDICESYGIDRGAYYSDDPDDQLPENALLPESGVKVYGFVERLYDKCLSRNSDEDGIKYWTQLLISGKSTGAAVSYEFVFSEEYVGAGHTDEEFLTMLYYTFFDREPDQEGFDFWLDMLQNTLKTRKFIFENFVNSQEYKEVCDDYMIDRGAYYSDEPCDQYTEIANFTTRLYSDVLGRKADKDGLDYWTLSMGTFILTPMDVSNEFFISEEFEKKETTDKEYIAVLYRTSMGREPDRDGEDFWLELLENKTLTRDEVRAQFLSSPEFADIMKETGIVEKPIVTVAKKEVGQQGGKPYLSWYGYNYRIEWCAVFVSWCANQCGYIDQGIVPKYKWCMDAKEWFLARGRWMSDNNYRPKSGDIIFYDWDGNGIIDHTGIVVGTDATGRIHTVEGNTKDVVRNDRKIYVGDPDICGYAIPAY
ncbi:MAG: DUF4214 domain-containing protein [Clostridiales bacterium]|nr:DUF4214 domain-containing protein [Clostridiales bacterium]